MNEDLRKIEFLSRKYDETNVPLYLSYPVHSFWKDKLNKQTIMPKPSNSIDDKYVYLHFPYCKSLCYYCNCYKYVTDKEAVIDRYIEYIKKEVELKRHSFNWEDTMKIKHMHWGGGTPTNMNMYQLERLFHSITQYAAMDRTQEATISIEAYPEEESITRDKLTLLRQLGFNKISFGIQDFDPRVQKAINRCCHEEITKKLIEMALELSFEVNVDLCYGLPFQGLNELEKTIKSIIKMSPNRIVLYPYTHFPMVFTAQRMIPSASIPNSFIKVMLVQMAEEILESNGYYRIGYDTYVKAGNRLLKRCKDKKIIRDFMGTSEETHKQMIGYGCSAISYTKDVYYQNTTRIKQYYEALDKGILPIDISNGHIFSHDDTIRSYLIRKSILADFCINKIHINQRFSINFDQYFAKEMKILHSFEKDGLIKGIDSENIIVTKEGKIFARHIAHVFDMYY